MIGPPQYGSIAHAILTASSGVRAHEHRPQRRLRTRPYRPNVTLDPYGNEGSLVLVYPGLVRSRPVNSSERFPGLPLDPIPLLHHPKNPIPESTSHAYPTNMSLTTWTLRWVLTTLSSWMHCVSPAIISLFAAITVTEDTSFPYTRTELFHPVRDSADDTTIITFTCNLLVLCLRFLVSLSWRCEDEVVVKIG